MRGTVTYASYAALVAVAAIVPAIACGGGKDKAVAPVPSATESATASSSVASVASSAPAASSVAAAPSVPPLAQILSPQETIDKIITAAAAAPSAAVAPANDPVEAGLKAAAAKHAPGMKPDGKIYKATLKQDEHAEAMMTLGVGKCYAIVGFSAPKGVEDFDLHLLAPPSYGIFSGEDTTDDNMPVIGKPPQAICPTVAVTLPYKIDMHAEKGAGVVAVQLFSKAKDK